MSILPVCTLNAAVSDEGHSRRMLCTARELPVKGWSLPICDGNHVSKDAYEEQCHIMASRIRQVGGWVVIVQGWVSAELGEL